MHNTPGSPKHDPPTQTEATGMAAEAIKSDILSSLREDISKIIREELKTALVEDLRTTSDEIRNHQ